MKKLLAALALTGALVFAVPVAATAATPIESAVSYEDYHDALDTDSTNEDATVVADEYGDLPVETLARTCYQRFTWYSWAPISPLCWFGPTPLCGYYTTICFN